MLKTEEGVETFGRFSPLGAIWPSPGVDAAAVVVVWFVFGTGFVFSPSNGVCGALKDDDADDGAPIDWFAACVTDKLAINCEFGIKFEEQSLDGVNGVDGGPDGHCCKFGVVDCDGTTTPGTDELTLFEALFGPDDTTLLLLFGLFGFRLLFGFWLLVGFWLLFGFVFVCEPCGWPGDCLGSKIFIFLLRNPRISIEIFFF